MPSFVSTAEAWWSTVPRGQPQARGGLGVGQAVGYQGEDLPPATGRPGHASSIGSGSPNSTSSSARSYGAPTAAQA